MHRTEVRRQAKSLTKAGSGLAATRSQRGLERRVADPLPVVASQRIGVQERPDSATGITTAGRPPGQIALKHYPLPTTPENEPLAAVEDEPLFVFWSWLVHADLVVEGVRPRSGS
jgi:hypothetical protein